MHQLSKRVVVDFCLVVHFNALVFQRIEEVNRAVHLPALAYRNVLAVVVALGFHHQVKGLRLGAGEFAGMAKEEGQMAMMVSL